MRVPPLPNAEVISAVAKAIACGFLAFTLAACCCDQRPLADATLQLRFDNDEPASGVHLDYFAFSKFGNKLGHRTATTDEHGSARIKVLVPSTMSFGVLEQKQRVAFANMSMTTDYISSANWIDMRLYDDSGDYSAYRMRVDVAKAPDTPTSGQR